MRVKSVRKLLAVSMILLTLFGMSNLCEKISNWANRTEPKSILQESTTIELAGSNGVGPFGAGS